MNEQHVWQMLDGLGTSLQLTAASLAVGCILALLMTLTLILRTPGLHWVNRGIITLFTGTPLLVQIFLVYYGPGQFDAVRECAVDLAEPTLVLCHVSVGIKYGCVQYSAFQRCV